MKNAFSAVNNIMPQMLSSEPNLYWSQNIILRARNVQYFLSVW